MTFSSFQPRYTARRTNGEHYKTWRCRGHANGSGCKNRHIDECELLQGIADEVGVKAWTINAQTVADVDRIMVKEGCVDVRMIKKVIASA